MSKKSIKKLLSEFKRRSMGLSSRSLLRHSPRHSAANWLRDGLRKVPFFSSLDLPGWALRACNHLAFPASQHCRLPLPHTYLLYATSIYTISVWQMGNWPGSWPTRVNYLIRINIENSIFYDVFLLVYCSFVARSHHTAWPRVPPCPRTPPTYHIAY